MADPRMQTGNRGRLQTGARNQATGVRPIGTAARDPNFVGIGLAKTLNIVERPVTGQGMGLVGMQSRAQTHERQYYDRNYYVTQLVNKSNEMAREIEKFKKQTEEISKDNQTFLTLEKKYESLTKEVRKLEGELADYNLAFDKLRAGARPEDIHNMYEHVRLQNERLRAQLDELFIERKSYEEQVNAFESQLNEIHQAAEMKLNELDPDQRNEYENSLAENRQLINNINMQRNELEDLNMILSQADAKLRMDDKKQKYKILREQIIALERRKDDLEVQTNENNLSFPEAKDRLMAKVKEDNKIILNSEKRLKEFKMMVESYEKQLREMQMDLEEKKNEEQDKQKYEILYQRDKEMTEFIDNFEDSRRKVQKALNCRKWKNMNRIEQNIVELLEYSSKALMMNTELPNKEQFLQIQSEFAHKKTHQENAEVTLQRLKIEYDQRMSDVKNFDQLEERMTLEKQNLNEKLAKMDDEINNKFNKITEYRKESEDKRQKLLRSRDDLSKQSSQIKEELISVSYEYEKKKQKMNLHDQFKVLTNLEKTFGQNEGQLYNLRSFIKSRTVDMDYKGLIVECNGMVETLNKVLLQQNGVK